MFLFIVAVLLFSQESSGLMEAEEYDILGKLDTSLIKSVLYAFLRSFGGYNYDVNQVVCV